MKTVTVAWLLVAAVVFELLLPAWDCTSYDCYLTPERQIDLTSKSKTIG